jgi:hypothetical protein
MKCEPANAAVDDIVGMTARQLERIAADPSVPPAARKAHARAARALYQSPAGRPRRNADIASVREAVELVANGRARSLRQAFLLVGRRQSGNASSTAKRLQKKYNEMKKCDAISFK